MNSLATVGINLNHPGTMASDSKASFHLGYLDGVRACAAIFVVWHHALSTANPDLTTLPAWEGFLLGILNCGHNAVDLFIVLSGFCLMLPVVSAGGTLKHGVGTFLNRDFPDGLLFMGSKGSMG